MNKRDRKRARRGAFEAEVRRRQEERRSQAPFTREQMVALMEYVARCVAADPSGAGFTHALEWLQANSVDSGLALSFLRSVGMADDWDVVIKANPYELFGSTETRLAWMPIEEQDLNDLLDYVEEALEKRGCQHDLAITSEWLRSKGYDEQIAGMALLSQGAGCDCEVALNVEAEAIYPRTQGSAQPHPVDGVTQVPDRR